MTKEQLAEQYAEGKSSSSVFQEAHKRDFLVGFNLAEELFKPKWISVEEELPETYLQHGQIYESDEVLLDCGDFYVVARYTNNTITKKEYFDTDYGITQDMVKAWMQIPQ